MTTCDEGRPTAVFAQVPGTAGAAEASWPDEEGDCPWCSILLGPGHEAELAPAEREPVPGRRTEPGGQGLRAWLERIRLVILPVAALTVLAALTVVAMA